MTQTLTATSKTQRKNMTKFPPNEIISLLDVNLKFNLAESTATNLPLDKLPMTYSFQNSKN